MHIVIYSVVCVMDEMIYEVKCCFWVSNNISLMVVAVLFFLVNGVYLALSLVIIYLLFL